MIVNAAVERNETGQAVLKDASYMPTVVVVNPNRSGADKYRVVPAGINAMSETRPEVFESNYLWNYCKSSWDRVRKVVGNDIPALAG